MSILSQIKTLAHMQMNIATFPTLVTTWNTSKAGKWRENSNYQSFIEAREFPCGCFSLGWCESFSAWTKWYRKFIFLLKRSNCNLWNFYEWRNYVHNKNIIFYRLLLMKNQFSGPIILLSQQCTARKSLNIFCPTVCTLVNSK